MSEFTMEYLFYAFLYLGFGSFLMGISFVGRKTQLEHSRLLFMMFFWPFLIVFLLGYAIGTLFTSFLKTKG